MLTPCRIVKCKKVCLTFIVLYMHHFLFISGIFFYHSFKTFSKLYDYLDDGKHIIFLKHVVLLFLHLLVYYFWHNHIHNCTIYMHMDSIICLTEKSTVCSLFLKKTCSFFLAFFLFSTTLDFITIINIVFVV